MLKLAVLNGSTVLHCIRNIYFAMFRHGNVWDLTSVSLVECMQTAQCLQRATRLLCLENLKGRSLRVARQQANFANHPKRRCCLRLENKEPSKFYAALQPCPDQSSKTCLCLCSDLYSTCSTSRVCEVDPGCTPENLQTNTEGLRPGIHVRAEVPFLQLVWQTEDGPVRESVLC